VFTGAKCSHVDIVQYNFLFTGAWSHKQVHRRRSGAGYPIAEHRAGLRPNVHNSLYKTGIMQYCAVSPRAALL
jgi:hypothetical protein